MMLTIFHPFFLFLLNQEKIIKEDTSTCRFHMQHATCTWVLALTTILGSDHSSEAEHMSTSVHAPQDSDWDFGGWRWIATRSCPRARGCLLQSRTNCLDSQSRWWWWGRGPKLDLKLTTRTTPSDSQGKGCGDDDESHACGKNVIYAPRQVTRHVSMTDDVYLKKLNVINIICASRHKRKQVLLSVDSGGFDLEDV
jgi:hypothetical protein